MTFIPIAVNMSRFLYKNLKLLIFTVTLQKSLQNVVLVRD